MPLVLCVIKYSLFNHARWLLFAMIAHSPTLQLVTSLLGHQIVPVCCLEVMATLPNAADLLVVTLVCPTHHGMEEAVKQAEVLYIYGQATWGAGYFLCRAHGISATS
ncbi:hypothetical protein ABBQ32_008894 [Trebouxia sp. C0010 RCD-2024]